MNIYESGEDYLETILMLKERKGNVRSIDIANEMSFTKPSVSYAMKQFRENGYITVDEDGFIHLTKNGEEIAKRVYERHLVLTQLLLFLGVSKDNAKKDACKIEHDLSEETFDRIKDHLKKNGIDVNFS
jgi:Mn-dependent DtxR family transcriptional regulator